MIVIGNGVVVDPKVLLAEIDGLAERGVDVSRLLISGDAHLIMPHHRALDRVVERYLGSSRIGTTGRGIGPAYGDKVARIGIRVQDLLDPGILRKKLELVLREKNQMLFKVYNRKAIDVDAVVEEYLAYAERLQPYIADTRPMLWDALDRGETVLLEGAQATMLDMDHGTYPFVTSSNPTAGGACVGAGIPPTAITQVIGVTKAYTTRVGSGPFPTELFDDNGEHLRKIGHEYGTTTGRERRCGWFDAVVARYACRLNGITDLVVTKLDVLTGLEKVPICVGYEIDGERFDDMPMTQTAFHHATPDLRGAGRLVGGHLQGPHRGRAAGQRPPLRRPDRGAVPAPGSASSASARAARRTSSAPPALSPHLDCIDREVAAGDHAWTRNLMINEAVRGRRIAACAYFWSVAVGVSTPSRSAWPPTRPSTALIARPGQPGHRRRRRAAGGRPRPIRPRSPRWPSRLGADLVVIGPEAPLVAGVADAVRAKGIACFGPSAGGRPAGGLEGVRQGRDGGGRGADRPRVRLHRRRRRSAAALDEFGAPYVVKNDGLAAGKGVVVTDDRADALAHAAGLRAGGGRGVPGRPRGVALRGHRRRRRPCRCCRRRTSSGSATATPARTPAAWARTRRCPGPRPAWSTRSWRAWCSPTLAEMRRRGTPFAGLLYVGLALTADGPEGDRVQRPLRRPGDPGRAGAAGDAAGRAAARRRDRHAGRAPAAALARRRGGDRGGGRARATRSRRAPAT